MDDLNYKQQFRTVLVIELVLIGLALTVAFSAWSSLCQGSLEHCFRNPDGVRIGTYIVLAALRPLTLFPMTAFTVMGIEAFGPVVGAMLSIISALVATSLVYLSGKVIGSRIVNPWLSSNLPQTLRFIRSQDWKIVILLRLVPILPFDLVSFFVGLADFRFKRVLFGTFLGMLPELYLTVRLTGHGSSVLHVTVITYTILCLVLLIPGLMYEIRSRRRGSSLWVRLKAMYEELLYEIQLNNDIVKRHSFHQTKTPVLLLYGFFSSRRALNVIERLLTAKGYEVLSFNLGGVLGVFFTKGIKEAATFIDFKLKRQFERNNFSKIHVVAHSKGGLVALWWLLRLGGDRYCKTVITMGTPFHGSSLTWLALITPLGFFWKDIWQMRPGSHFLRELADSPIPEGVQIFCLYSRRDGIARGGNAIFKPTAGSEQVFPVPVHRVAHFEFLYRREVVEIVASILGPPSEAEAYTGQAPQAIS